MKTPALFIILGFSTLLLPMCKPAHAYDKYIKELDSLKVVVEQAVDNFNTVDSLACYEAWAKQDTYSSFLSARLNDTVSAKEAESLQHFFNIGKPLHDYLTMRSVWVSEAKTGIKQVSQLSNDLKNGSVETAEAIEFINDEKKSSEKIIEELKVNTALIRKHLEVYTKTLPAIENMIRNINSGELPVIIKPEIKSL
ncbi:MAG: hypothetical protein V4506_06665 [Bacteroidota bacterium]